LHTRWRKNREIRASRSVEQEEGQKMKDALVNKPLEGYFGPHAR
jgi:hypothetical protein